MIEAQVVQEVPVTFNVTEDMVDDFLTTAFEGGIHYWCHSVQCFDADGQPANVFSGKYVGRCNLTIHESTDGEDPAIPHDFNCFCIEDEDSVVRKGLALMATKTPRHLVDLIMGDYDATTADVFVQMCIFGEVKYG